MENRLQQVASLFTQSDRILFVTGAGVSADSGLPTYRGVGGLYDSGETEDGVAIEHALSGPMFATRPAITWKYLWQIACACAGATPNAAHQFIAEIESEKPDVWVVTQNVDSLHRAAGSRNLVEVHGQVFDLYCANCRREYCASELFSDFTSMPELPPRCGECAGVIRPRVVLFDEFLPNHVIERLGEIAELDFDLVVAIGTTAVFPYIRAPILHAQHRNSPTVEINPTRTDISDGFTYHVELAAAEAFRRIRACMH